MASNETGTPCGGDTRLEPKVATLIGGDGSWDMAKVRQHVTQEDAEIIEQMILPCNHRQSDRFIWPFSKTGEPDARSVYHHLRDTTPSTPHQSRKDDMQLRL